MATKQSVVVLSPSTHLCPPPLHIRKKSRRATFYRRVIRKSPHQPNYDCVYGPLDDIINQISGDIWASPSEWNPDSTSHELAKPLEGLLDWHNPLKAPSTCTISTVTPLPVSRIPSNQPLTIRKNRSSRSTASESSASCSMMDFSRSSKKSVSTDSSKVCSSLDEPPASWSRIDVPWQVEHSEPTSSNNTICTTHTPAQQALEDAHRVGDSSEAKRHSSRVRLISSSLSRLLRPSSEAKGSELAIQEENDDGDANELDEILKTPNTESVEAFMSKHGKDQIKIGTMMKQVAERLPSPLGNRYGTTTSQGQGSSSSFPTTLKPTISVLPEVKLLTSDEVQDFWVGIEIEGMLHNRLELPDSSIDVVFVVDNGKECLSRALSIATGALHQLERGDRIALYTTHCTHVNVASTVPDRLLPLRPISRDTEDIFRDLTSDIAVHGIQHWTPPRPNPPMTRVILAIAKSLEKDNPKHGRCHIILLSPIFDVLHSVSETFPDLRIHQINPALLPYIPNEEHREMVCLETCCRNVFVSNWTHYQSVPSRIRQIILQARSETPLGDITNVHVNLYAEAGCKILDTDGLTTLSALRPGQASCFFVRLRVSPSKTQDLASSLKKNPVLNYSLDATNLRHELYAANMSDAEYAHLLSIQVSYQNTLNPPGHWTYTQAPLAILTKLGRLAPPMDVSSELYKRRVFNMLAKVDNELAKKEVDNLVIFTSNERQEIQQVVHRMRREIYWHHEVLEYEATSRQKLPSCCGPIDIAPAENHQHIQAMLDARMNRRMGMAFMRG
ncbi:hypothetical protein N0V90_007515 [Kalmusia sp. IMI 367209]|nr:hypothetical protein N0V90_007515 [Kalmusia sp. IMI 367209]